MALNGWLLETEKLQEECLGGIKAKENWRLRYNEELI
jgi:hypothetical protein